MPNPLPINGSIRSTANCFWKFTHHICQTKKLSRTFDGQVLKESGFIYKLIAPYEKTWIPLCWIRPQWEFHLFHEGEKIYSCRLPAAQMINSLNGITKIVSYSQQQLAKYTVTTLSKESRLLTRTDKPFTKPVFPLPPIQRIKTKTKTNKWLVVMIMAIAVLFISGNYPTKLLQMFQTRIMNSTMFH